MSLNIAHCFFPLQQLEGFLPPRLTNSPQAEVDEDMEEVEIVAFREAEHGQRRRQTPAYHGDDSDDNDGQPRVACAQQ